MVELVPCRSLQFFERHRADPFEQVRGLVQGQLIRMVRLPVLLSANSRPEAAHLGRVDADLAGFEVAQQLDPPDAWHHRVVRLPA